MPLFYTDFYTEPAGDTPTGVRAVVLVRGAGTTPDAFDSRGTAGPGGVSLRNLALIALGRTSEVSG